MATNSDDSLCLCVKNLENWFPVVLFEGLNVPAYHLILEIFLGLWVLWLIFHKSYNPNDLVKLSRKEKEQLIEEWQPEELVSDVPENHKALNPYILSGKAGKYITLNGYHCLNLASHNYLGFIGNAEIEESAIQTLRKYGVGSCGPRGFYGTVDVHLDLEQKLAQYMLMEDAVVYSYGFSTAASAIPAYSKRGDIIFVDECVNFAIQKGLDASRSTIQFFKHNDVEHLEQLLRDQYEEDIKNPKKARRTRKFLVIEGIYLNQGDICPLPELIEVCKRYKLRIFIDESVSFGTLGAHGRGVTEYYGVDLADVDLIMCSMEWTLGTIGGFCVGTSFIVEHQRLSGLGYCFSASLPPLLATAAITALDLMSRDQSMFMDLRKKCELVHSKFLAIEDLTVIGHCYSPVKYLVFKDHIRPGLHSKRTYEAIADYCIKHGVAIITPSYLEDREKLPRELQKGIRVTVNRLLIEDEINHAASVINSACKEILKCISDPVVNSNCKDLLKGYRVSDTLISAVA